MTTYSQTYQSENQGYLCGLAGIPKTDIENWPHISDSVREAWLKGWVKGDAEKNTDIRSAASTMGKKGGSAKSPRKKLSSRENGKKGGRPRKVKP